MIFVELNMKGRQHLLSNCGFIDKFADAEKCNLFFADSLHAREVTEMSAAASKLQSITVPVLRSGAGLKAAAKTLNEALFVFLVFLVSVVRRDDIFFLSAYASVKVFIELMSRIFPVRVYLVHHGELTGLNSASVGRYSRFVRRYFAIRRSTRLTDVFLSEAIKKNAYAAAGRETPSSMVVLHPFPLKMDRVPKNVGGSKMDRPRIGYFGALSRENRARLQAAISALTRRTEALGCQDFELMVIAPNSGTFDYGNLQSVRTVDTTVQITNTEYALMVASFDLAIFPYESQQYDLTASGIAVDCLIHNIHFFAANSGFFCDWVQRYQGIGTLFPSFKALLDALEDPKFELLCCE